MSFHNRSDALIELLEDRGGLRLQFARCLRKAAEHLLVDRPVNLRPALVDVDFPWPNNFPMNCASDGAPLGCGLLWCRLWGSPWVGDLLEGICHLNQSMLLIRLSEQFNTDR